MDSIDTKTMGPGLFCENELAAIEEDNPDGLSSGEIVNLFSSRGMRLSESTFRKYVQLGLLPRSRRIGSKGKHKGSRGLYPAGVVRQINEIKRMMSLNYTIEDIRRHFAFVGGEIEELRTILWRILERLENSLGQDECGDLALAGLQIQITQARETSEILVGNLEESAKRIREMRQLAREAV